MKIFRKLDQIPRDFGPTVVTVGNYDGLHLGHRQILKQMVERAKQLQARSVVLTFDPHPIRILRPREAPPLITPMPYKLRLLEETGLDAVVILPFTRDLSTMPPFEFAEQIISTALHAVEVHEGFNFRFGHRAEGNLDRLREYGARLGFTVRAYDALQARGYVASSSQVRDLIAAGQLAPARHLLARPFRIYSNPGRGRGYGHKYTVPTINLSRYDELVPKDGVYITQIAVSGECFDAVTNVGNRPTFGAESFAIETHILNFHPIELTVETNVELTFLKRLRDEIKFPSVDALRDQISRDVHHARRYFELLSILGSRSAS
ncbi:MAG: bifunctional riboflavin kinase/FAD synthetase [Candidatus Korobacteraceae bacterium]|jgi:riboflavin kinase/FMN adenylyltransferase